MIVVSNSSPLINLARIGQIALLRELYGELWIPEAVRREVVEVEEEQERRACHPALFELATRSGRIPY